MYRACKMFMRMFCDLCYSPLVAAKNMKSESRVFAFYYGLLPAGMMPVSAN